MRWRVVLVAVVLSSCRCDERVMQALPNCGEPCVIAPDGTILTNVGTCKTGLVQCLEDGGTECGGYVLPASEVCDGQDNDCDGKLDNTHESPRLCTSACELGVQFCVRGLWTTCSARMPRAETCNGYDDDCDSIIDNNLPVEPCFEAQPPASPLFGICHGGTRRCMAGVSRCYGQQLPRPEACNGIDEDCDGVIDNGAATRFSIDFVFIFDNSGSMSDVAAALKNAISTWAAKYSAYSERRYALVAAPDNNFDTYGCKPTLVRNFTDTNGIAIAVNAQTGYSGSGIEPTLTALERVLNVTENPFGLTWSTSSNRRVVLMFSDEVPQGYQSPDGIACTDDSMAAQSRVLTELSTNTTFKLHVFTRTGAYPSAWQPLATAGRGRVFDVAGGALDLEAALDQIVQELVCGP